MVLTENVRFGYAPQMTTFNDVFEHFGRSYTRMAKTLGCSRAAISQWHGKIPLLRAYQIQVLTGGKFLATDIIAGTTPKIMDS